MSAVDREVVPPTTVACWAPLIKITELLTMPVPVTERAAELAPACAVVGETEVIVGAGFTTCKENDREAPPPGGGFTTVMGNGPVTSRSDAGMLVKSCVLFRNWVVRFVPLMATVDDETNPVPLIIKVRAGPLANVATVCEGEREVIVGVGLVVGLIVRVSGGLEVPPPGCWVKTTMLTEPGF